MDVTRLAMKSFNINKGCQNNNLQWQHNSILIIKRLCNYSDYCSLINLYCLCDELESAQLVIKTVLLD